MYQPFAAALRAILRRNHWQDRRIAEEVGVSRSTISRWLNGKQELRNLQELVDIAEALQVTTDELLGLAGHEISQIVELLRQLPEDLRQVELSRLQKLVEDYRGT
ncbi:helix-turn-helix domain-containing protein [Endozoicomonas sp. SCSIO W0465]|uniref:helix-turn-helix domain-containing protein n=1 Tax=Endozoicomonas sp. SCSIO W0465 TaxID=2918516 RepID=UPI0020760689|nr:helix-turn-helix transcriptional regulator [Endozoicomonas sp. SCSIO W0465]USE37931.1 helix-turn-helix domain-containing protein [Endozoicomonas sp. SCSIO W0465]